MSRTIVYWLALLLLVLGFGLAVLRHFYMDIPLVPKVQTEVWTIEARIDFAAANGPVLASFSIPEAPTGYRIFKEQAASPGYGFAILDKEDGRRAEWTKREAKGNQTLYYKIQVTPRRHPFEDKPEPESLENIPLQPVFWSDPENAAAEALLEQALAISSSPESLARELIKALGSHNADQNAALLLSHNTIENVLPHLLAKADVKSRILWGLFLEDKRRNQPLSPVLQVFTDSRWEFFDIHSGSQGLPLNFFSWYYKSPSLLDLAGGTAGRISFSMSAQTIPALEMAKIQSDTSVLSFLSMYHLPLEQQNVLKLLLLLPIGALVVVFMRMIIGVRTSGTFMPILIAMAFLQTTLLSGLLNFVGIVVLGLLLRGYLSRLNLLLVARISVIAILVILLMVFVSLVVVRLGFHTGIQATSFPVIIMAWTIERMSILWEEEGMREVAVQGSGSLIVAVIAYLFMGQTLVKHLSFNFPELNLVIAAFILLLGHYTGYRLFELKRFAAMINNKA
ncbi:inactive transglutaminase family protein [Desulfococcaceae bacterium OttesenSCG-928-F15]|nr:inactive transglutaminase family protein [Desulfococcaceae bacterium OttesenSCG-928-F15]